MRSIGEFKKIMKKNKNRDLMKKKLEEVKVNV